MECFKKLLVLVIVAVLPGCAFHAQKAQIAPIVQVAQSNEGKGAAIGLRVLDERPSQSLGRRGTAAVARGAEITTDQNIAAVIQDKVAQGLQSKGYVVKPYGESETRLSLELRELEYTTSTGFWTGGVHVNGAIKAVGNKPGDSYERMYCSEKERRIMVVPTAGKNEADINESLGELLRGIFEDVGLLRFLAPSVQE